MPSTDAPLADHPFIASIEHRAELPPGGHWSLRLAAGTVLRLSDPSGRGNCGVLLYHRDDLAERYNAPDTLKEQHTFRLTRGHCLYSDMGRVLASIVEDDLDGHDTVCGNLRPAESAARYGARDYQRDRNGWRQNGHDAFLVELAKYGLGLPDLVSNLNAFSHVAVGADGALRLDPDHGPPGARLTLRIELDTLVLLHACPHPLDPGERWPAAPIGVEIGLARPRGDDDPCENLCDENRRGFENNRLYRLGIGAPMTSAARRATRDGAPKAAEGARA